VDGKDTYLATRMSAITHTGIATPAATPFRSVVRLETAAGGIDAMATEDRQFREDEIHSSH